MGIATRKGANMWYFVLSIIILILSIRIILINFEIKNITQQLNDLTLEKTRKKLTTTVGHRNTQKLCVEINQSLRKQQEQQIATKNHEEELKQSISNLSHDLRTPLTAIIGYITLLKQDRVKAEEYLDIIEDRAKALNKLVNEFYELSVIEDNEYMLELSEIDIVAVLTNVLMGSFTLFEDKKIIPQIYIPDKAVHIIGNIDAYERVFQNLISNAVKFNEKHVVISLVEENEKCIITISNTTSGIDSEEIQRIFDRFYTADSSRTNKNTGLGLYIVKTLCEMMGANVSGKLSDLNTLAIEIIINIL